MSNPILKLSKEIRKPILKQVDQPMTEQVMNTLHGDILDAVMGWLDDNKLIGLRAIPEETKHD